MSISEWCKRHGVPANRFYYWRQRLGTSCVSEAGVGFVLVGSSEPVELLIGEQVRIKVPSNFDRIALKAVLEVLGC